MLRARKYLEGETEFLANYAGMSDLLLDTLIEKITLDRMDGCPWKVWL